MRILIVEDDAGVRDVCARALRRDGHEVAACASGEEAVPRLSEAWDLVVTDLSMPGSVDGSEIVRRARAVGTADVAVMTAYPTLESSIAAMKDGACDYLLKPFSTKSLLDLAHRCRAGRHPLAPEPEILTPRELRTATILFADVRGFSSFADTAPPEETARQLDLMLSCLIRAVHAEGGTINTFIGDGAMALFGLPLPHPDPAGAAVRAALRARDAVASASPLRFGFGVNTGEVSAGTLGTAERAEYTVVGAPVNAAARLQAAAEPGMILVGAETSRLLDGRFRLGPERALALKGFSGTFSARELRSAAPRA